MKITVITATLNSAASIKRCVKSVVNQSYKYFEHIIVDSLSDDNTISIIKDIYSNKNLLSNLTIISEKDDGISDAFNKGIKLAKGEIVTILNSDDYYYSDEIFKIVAESFVDSSILFVHGNILFVDKIYGSNIRRPLLCDVKEAMPYNHPTMFVRKSLYDKIGLYDNNYKYAMDFDFICKIKDSYENIDSISFYIQGDPITVMLAGGASWENENKSIKETKEILIRHNFWDSRARINYYFRLFRVRIKTILNFIGLNYFIKLWRKNKWGSNK